GVAIEMKAAAAVLMGELDVEVIAGDVAGAVIDLPVGRVISKRDRIDGHRELDECAAGLVRVREGRRRTRRFSRSDHADTLFGRAAGAVRTIVVVAVVVDADIRGTEARIRHSEADRRHVLLARGVRVDIAETVGEILAGVVAEYARNTNTGRRGIVVQGSRILDMLGRTILWRALRADIVEIAEGLQRRIIAEGCIAD